MFDIVQEQYLNAAVLSSGLRSSDKQEYEIHRQLNKYKYIFIDNLCHNDPINLLTMRSLTQLTKDSLLKFGTLRQVS